MTALFRKILLIGIALYCQAGYAQPSPPPATASSREANIKTIKTWYDAFEKKDWNEMQQILADGFTFSSPLDDHIDIKAFKERCWPNAYKIKHVDWDKFVIDGDLAFVIGNGYTTEGKLFRNSDCFMLKDGKIKAYECFFGPGVNYPNSGK
jgi:SnoaL-like domain